MVAVFPPSIPIAPLEAAMAPTSVTSSKVIRRRSSSSAWAAVSANAVPSGMVNVISIWVLSISGIKAVPWANSSTALNTSSATERIKTTARWFKDTRMSFS